MDGLDLRGRTPGEASRAIVECYNASTPGAQFAARVDTWSASLRMTLLEAGAQHEAARLDDGSWKIEVRRRSAAAQGTMPGLHHVVTDGRSIWAAERGKRVARIDVSTGRIAAERAVASRASHLALAADAQRIFVADSEANAVLALRASDLEPLERWNAPGAPQLPLASPQGIVCVTGPASGTLTIARPAGPGYRVQTVEVGECPHDALLSPDGAHLFVPCVGAAELVKVRLSDGAVAGRASTGAGPSHLALHPQGERLYSANSWDGSVSALTLDGARVAEAKSGGGAHAVDIDPLGRWLYVANFFDDTISVFDAASLERRFVLASEPYAHGLDVCADGRYLVATGFASDCLRIFDARQPREIARLKVGWGSSHTAFAGGSAFVGCSVSDHVARVDLDRLSLAGRIALH